MAIYDENVCFISPDEMDAPACKHHHMSIALVNLIEVSSLAILNQSIGLSGGR